MDRKRVGAAIFHPGACRWSFGANTSTASHHNTKSSANGIVNLSAPSVGRAGTRGTSKGTPGPRLDRPTRRVCLVEPVNPAVNTDGGLGSPAPVGPEVRMNADQGRERMNVNSWYPRCEKGVNRGAVD